MVERGLRAAGHRTGRYTSPHLMNIEERVAIDGVPVDSSTFDAVTGVVLDTADGLRRRGQLQHWPTFFEVTTAIAFEIFRQQGVTVGVIEVGLGGRFDATNIIDPLLTAITSIAFDHERHLGRTLTDIAFEKAGIIKPGVPVVVGPMLPEPHAAIAGVARERGAALIDAAPQHAPAGTGVALALSGGHQRDNAAVAVEVLKLCRQHGLGIDAAQMVTALTDVVWPARLEWVRVPDAGDVLIDAAHNPAGAQALAAYVLDNTGPLPLVMGVMKDKDVAAILVALAPAVSRFVATGVSSPRALDAEALADRMRLMAHGGAVEVRLDPVAAVLECLSLEPRVMAAGSIFLVGPLRAKLLARGAIPVRYPSKAGLFFFVG
jgi:dihydrofolate synthase/folylpolyglutamate synthase